ncbi:MAG: Fe-S cluster assembly protein HesB [Aequorivita sp.]|nr:Fe-S cluster assembly protein HesB [Aequorivita sp.]|tara:strand:+ start:6666 stop:7184 length:519 start_codon:yes stop_codon:yes gene_type:complete
MKTIWTIGHSTRSLEEFVKFLHAFNIKTLVDVRHFPGSRKFPQYNKDSLAQSLPENKINYKHLVDLGGRRKPKPESKNNAWRLDSFKGYADYMETAQFQTELQDLKEIALTENTAIMCAEAVWWSCHRSLIADILKVDGWKVFHIMSEKNATEHPFTAPAKVIDGHLNYSKN